MIAIMPALVVHQTWHADIRKSFIVAIIILQRNGTGLAQVECVAWKLSTCSYGCYRHCNDHENRSKKKGWRCYHTCTYLLNSWSTSPFLLLLASTGSLLQFLHFCLLWYLQTLDRGEKLSELQDKTSDLHSQVYVIPYKKFKIAVLCCFSFLACIINLCCMYVIQAQEFKKQGVKIRRKTWLQNMKIKLVVLGILLLLVLIVWVSVCQGFDCTKHETQ